MTIDKQLIVDLLVGQRVLVSDVVPPDIFADELTKFLRHMLRDKEICITEEDIRESFGRVECRLNEIIETGDEGNVLPDNPNIVTIQVPSKEGWFITTHVGKG